MRQENYLVMTYEEFNELVARWIGVTGYDIRKAETVRNGTYLSLVYVHSGWRNVIAAWREGVIDLTPGRNTIFSWLVGNSIIASGQYLVECYW